MPFKESAYRKYKRDSKGRFVKGSHKKFLLSPFFRYSLAIKNLYGAGLGLEDVSRFDAIITVIKVSARSEMIDSEKSNSIKKKLRKMLHKHLDEELWDWNASNAQTIEAYEVEQISRDELSPAQINRAYSRIIVNGNEEALRSEMLH